MSGKYSDIQQWTSRCPFLPALLFVCISSHYTLSCHEVVEFCWRLWYCSC